MYLALPYQYQHETLLKPLKFWPGRSFNQLYAAKTTSVAINKPHRLPHLHMVNNAHLLTWTLYAKIQLC